MLTREQTDHWRLSRQRESSRPCRSQRPRTV